MTNNLKLLNEKSYKVHEKTYLKFSMASSVKNMLKIRMR